MNSTIHSARLLTLLMGIFAGLLITSVSNAQEVSDSPVLFSTDSTHITVWKGEAHSPLFIKGVNLGVAVPGTFTEQLPIHDPLFIGHRPD